MKREYFFPVAQEVGVLKLHARRRAQEVSWLPVGLEHEFFQRLRRSLGFPAAGSGTPLPWRAGEPWPRPHPGEPSESYLLGYMLSRSVASPVRLSLMATVFPRTSFSRPPSWSNRVAMVGRHSGPYSGHIPTATRPAGAGRARNIVGRASQHAGRCTHGAQEFSTRTRSCHHESDPSTSKAQLTAMVGSPNSVPGAAGTPGMERESFAPGFQNRAERARLFTQRVTKVTGVGE